MIKIHHQKKNLAMIQKGAIGENGYSTWSVVEVSDRRGHVAHGKVTAYLSIKGITLPLLTSHPENVEKRPPSYSGYVFSVFWFGKFGKKKFSIFS
jgi:hypothetical protein